MITRVAQVPVPVGNYDEALDWYTHKLGLEIRANDEMGPGYRWVTVAPPGQDLELVLHLSGASTDHRAPEGQSPLLVFRTDDCSREYDRLRACGVTFSGPPRSLPWGKQAMIIDPYGNAYVLLEARGAPKPPPERVAQA
jgi:predicted enzyme related to lactoylglutathione lyase